MLEAQGHRIIVGIDRSGSMDEQDCEGQSRYQYLGEKVVALANTAVQYAYNNELTLLFFSSNTNAISVKSGADVEAAFKKYQTGGGTNTSGVIEAAFKKYQETPEVPALFFLVTDGHPTEPSGGILHPGRTPESAVEDEIVSITKRIKQPEDFRIMLLTVGTRDAHLTQWLGKLDAGLTDAAYDIVGQNNLNEVTFQEAAAELIKSSTTNAEALAGKTAGKETVRIDA